MDKRKQTEGFTEETLMPSTQNTVETQKGALSRSVQIETWRLLAHRLNAGATKRRDIGAAVVNLELLEILAALAGDLSEMASEADSVRTGSEKL